MTPACAWLRVLAKLAASPWPNRRAVLMASQKSPSRINNYCLMYAGFSMMESETGS